MKKFTKFLMVGIMMSAMVGFISCSKDEEKEETKEEKKAVMKETWKLLLTCFRTETIRSRLSQGSADFRNQR